MHELTGYTSRLTVAPGDKLDVMISSAESPVQGDLVQLRHGDDNSGGPGYRETVVQSPMAPPMAVGVQRVRVGSYARIEAPSTGFERLSFQAFVLATRPAGESPQGIMCAGSAEKGGLALLLDSAGRLTVTVRWPGARAAEMRCDDALRPRTWYLVAGGYDAVDREVGLSLIALDPLSPEPPRQLRRSVPEGGELTLDPDLLIGAGGPPREHSTEAARWLYNGKIDSPRVFSCLLTSTDLAQIRDGPDVPQQLDQRLEAAWDLSGTGASIEERTGRWGDGVLINMPTRAVTGRLWRGSAMSPRAAPEQYTAVHFHDDDLEDASWSPAFTFDVPPDLPSGVYAARLTTSTAEDRLPFIVTPPKGRASANVLVLMPTLTYRAYANERWPLRHDSEELGLAGRPMQLVTGDLQLSRHPEFGSSLYDVHSDGSGVCYATLLRPMPNLRPTHRSYLVGAARHFGGDLYLIDWLMAKDIAHDVVGDEDLHEQGVELLRRYRVVVTGGHPEYWTESALNAVEHYLAQGGRLMYLGGNGFYWVTSIDPERPHVIEVRRGRAGTRPWESWPGEEHHSTTGEPGGLWRYRGRPPNRLVGIGFAAQGWDSRSRPYRRGPHSFHEKVSFIFEGVSADEDIGDFGLVMGGAAGDELDCVDAGYGTPPHAVLLASSSGHSRFYRPAVENGLFNMPDQPSEHSDVRADMVYLETPSGGAVFSVGSISWTGSLSHNGYDNNVSRITENVLRRFSTA